MSKILAGDIGGTHTRLALFEESDGNNPVMLSEQDSESASWRSLEEESIVTIPPPWAS